MRLKSRRAIGCVAALLAVTATACGGPGRDEGAKHAVERVRVAMGSELRVETRANWGTRFSFELDLPPAAAAA